MDQWLEITLPAVPETLSDLEARLCALGFDSFWVEDSRDFEERREGWDYADEALCAYYQNLCQIKLYLPEDKHAPPKLEILRELVPALSVKSRAEEDWAESWKQYYHPMPIGQRLLVQPAWLPLDNPEGRCVFRNNPGMSFGTGLHATTRLCLEMLEALPLADKHVLDIGCGSGILSLCALILGAAKAFGLDTDPQAAEISLRNAADNHLTGRYDAAAGNVLRDAPLRTSLGTWDVVCSNIVADVIIALAPLVNSLLMPEGLWLVSGIITPRLPDVLAALSCGNYRILEQRSSEGWEALLLTTDHTKQASPNRLR